MLSVDWPRALAWRLRRHLLEPVGGLPVEGVVGRLGALPAQSDAGMELAVRTRRQVSEAGEVAHALADGRLVRTFAFRGATHLVTPEEGGTYLALRAASRMWELPSWQQHYELAPGDWPGFRATVREALADGPLTIEELGAAVMRGPAFRRAGSALAAGAWTLVKPLAWQGDLCFGASRDGRSTLQRLDGNRRWAGIPALDDAGPRAVEAYLRAYGPTTPARLHYWLGQGLGVGRRQIDAWIAGLGDRLAAVEVGGEVAGVLRDDLDELAATPPSRAVRLLPAYDQWLLGPGTADAGIVPPAHRARFSRGANPAVAGGVAVGTWAAGQDGVAIDWFAGSDQPDEGAVAQEVARLGTILGRELAWTIRTG